MGIALSVVLTILIIGMVAWPFFRKQSAWQQHRLLSDPMMQVAMAHEQVNRELADLAYDLQMGKVTTAAYEQVRAELALQLADVKEEEQVVMAKIGTAVEQEVAARVARRRLHAQRDQ